MAKSHNREKQVTTNAASLGLRQYPWLVEANNMHKPNGDKMPTQLDKIWNRKIRALCSCITLGLDAQIYLYNAERNSIYFTIKSPKYSI
jgi:hypothetical protein